MNGGFGLVLDGSDEAEERSQCMLQWDVSNGVSGNMVRLHMDWLILYADASLTLILEIFFLSTMKGNQRTHNA